MPWLIITMNGLFFFLLLEQDVAAPIQVNHPKHDMPEEVRKQVYQALLARSKNGKLEKKDTTIVAPQFGVHIRSVQRLWKLSEVKPNLLITFWSWLLVKRKVDVVIRKSLLI